MEAWARLAVLPDEVREVGSGRVKPFLAPSLGSTTALAGFFGGLFGMALSFLGWVTVIGGVGFGSCWGGGGRLILGLAPGGRGVWGGGSPGTCT